MTMIKMHEKSNWRHMASVQSQFREGAKQAAHDIATALVSDIRQNWGVGTAPEVDSGNLDSAVMINPRGRDSAGRFAKDDAITTYVVTVNAPDGSAYHGRGNYSRALEEGWSNGTNGGGPFPFLQPAIERVAPLYPAIVKRRVTK